MAERTKTGCSRPTVQAVPMQVNVEVSHRA